MLSTDSFLKSMLSGAQMLFVAFGALVLVPLLTGLNPSVALFTAGVGTLLFQWVTHRSVPIFLASSFAFIAPILYSTQTWGVSDTLGGLMAAGVVYMLLGVFVKFNGVGFLHRLMPPLVTGPVIMVIGLGSNIAQFMYADVAIFGGMSGVIYGLLGYGWIWSLVLPEQSLHIPKAVIIFMLVWLVLCFMGFASLMGVGDVANAAHLGGLIMGMLMGLGAGLIEKSSTKAA